MLGDYVEELKLIKLLKKEFNEFKVVKDCDYLRIMFPDFNGKNKGVMINISRVCENDDLENLISIIKGELYELMSKMLFDNLIDLKGNVKYINRINGNRICIINHIRDESIELVNPDKFNSLLKEDSVRTDYLPNK